MKRTALKRKTQMKRPVPEDRKVKTTEKKPVVNERNRRPPSFKDPQMRCRVPGCPSRGRDPHHVVLMQHVEREHGDIWDPRNALSICRAHHEKHHGAERWKIPTLCLRDENIEFAAELLGRRAAAYLRHRYDAARDPRIRKLES
jgi:hypothetical protein